MIKHANGDVTWEAGNNRIHDNVATITHSFFRFPYRASPRFAGVNVPVFSLNTRSNFGCGEFNDLKKLGDFCHKAGLRVI